MRLSADIVNTVGLALDIVGVVLLFRFGLPPDVRRSGASFLVLEDTDGDEARKAHRYDKISWSALGIIVLGFILQIVSTWM